MPEYLIDHLKLALQYVLPSLLGASGLAAVWYKGRIDRDREKTKRRRELIDTWRKDLLADWEGAIRIGGRQTTYAFMERPAYWSLRTQLSPAFRSKIESDTPTICVGSNASLYPRTELSEEITRIEQEWKLV